MTEKRFRLGADFDGFNNIYDNERTIGCERTIYATKMVKLLNELYEENQRLKQYTKQVLQNHLDGWKGVYNPIDENEVVEINIVKSIAEDLGVDLE